MIIATATDAADLFRPSFEAAAGSHIVVAHLDGGRQLIDLAELGGERAEGDLPVRRIIEDALRLGAAGLLVARNHPGGDAQPTWDEVETTRALAETAARLGIRVHDALIFAGDDVTSLRALGLL